MPWSDDVIISHSTHGYSSESSFELSLLPLLWEKEEGERKAFSDLEISLNFLITFLSGRDSGLPSRRSLAYQPHTTNDEMRGAEILERRIPEKELFERSFLMCVALFSSLLFSFSSNIFSSFLFSSPLPISSLPFPSLFFSSLFLPMQEPSPATLLTCLSWSAFHRI